VTTVIHADGLTRRFGRLLAVDSASFDVEQGSILGLLGPNGSGKSTLIRMLCGVLRPSEGTARVQGVDIRQDPEAVKRNIGYMSQKFSLYADLNVVENLRFYARVYGLTPSKQREREDAVLALTGVVAHREKLAGRLSGGWKQRLALACAMIHEPEVLFLDEPTAGIDPVARRELWDLLFDLRRRGVTMLVSTHYMDEAERCTHVGYLYQGKLLAMGLPVELKTSPTVNPEGMRRFELTCRDPAEALGRSRELNFIHDGTLFGDTVHLLAAADVPSESLLNMIAPHDTTASLRPISASLEDAFVFLSRTRARELRE